jgi:hypothetical protein
MDIWSKCPIPCPCPCPCPSPFIYLCSTSSVNLNMALRIFLSVMGVILYCRSQGRIRWRRKLKSLWHGRDGWDGWNQLKILCASPCKRDLSIDTSNVNDIETKAETFRYRSLGSKRNENVSVRLRNLYIETKTFRFSPNISISKQKRSYLVQMFLYWKQKH